MFFEKFEQIVTYNFAGVKDVQPILLDIESVSYFSPMVIVNEEGNIVKKYTKFHFKNGDSVNINIEFEYILKKLSF
jgi:uncharacterized protein affecting Mg2+/Co2+ transport